MKLKTISLLMMLLTPLALLAADQNSDLNGQNNHAIQVRLLERVETDFTRIGLVFSTCSSSASILNVWAASGHDTHDAFGFNLLKNASDLGSKIIALVVLRQNESPNTIGRSLLSQLERQWGRKAVYCGLLSGVSSLIADTAYRFRGDDCSDLCSISAGVKNGSSGLALLSEGYALLTDFKRPHNDDERSAAGRRVYALIGLGFSVTSTTLSTIIDHAGITGKTPLTVLAYLRDGSSILALVSDFRATFKVAEFYQGRPGDLLLPELTNNERNELIDWLRNIRDAALACHDQQNTRSNSHNRFEYLTLPFSVAVVGFELNRFDERGDPTRQKVTVLFGQINENAEE